MADVKITELPEAASLPAGAVVPIVDVTDTTEAATGTTKRIDADLLAGAPGGPEGAVQYHGAGGTPAGFGDYDPGTGYLTIGESLSLDDAAVITTASYPGALDFELTGMTLRVIPAGVVGSAEDAFFQLIPPTESGYGYIESFGAAGMVIGSGQGSVLIRPQRYTIAEFSAAGGVPKQLVHTLHATSPGRAVRGSPGQTADLDQYQASDGSTLSAVRADGSLRPAALADAGAANDSLYYSTDAGKLAYKDPAGTVHPLY